MSTNQARPLDLSRPFAELLVPTTDTIRYTWLLDRLLGAKHHVLVSAPSPPNPNRYLPPQRRAPAWVRVRVGVGVWVGVYLYGNSGHVEPSPDPTSNPGKLSNPSIISLDVSETQP